MVITDAGAAVSGQMVSTAGGPWTISTVVDKVNGAAEAVDLRLVRGDMEGRVDVVAVISGVTPLQVEHIETRLERGSRCYYRLLVRSRTSMLTSNPIFVRGAGLTDVGDDPPAPVHALAGAEGRNYLDLERFSAAGIEVIFQEYVPAIYPQLFGDFASHLSTLDLVLNCGSESRDILRAGRRPGANRGVTEGGMTT